MSLTQFFPALINNPFLNLTSPSSNCLVVVILPVKKEKKSFWKVFDRLW